MSVSDSVWLGTCVGLLIVGLCALVAKMVRGVRELWQDTVSQHKRRQYWKERSTSNAVWAERVDAAWTQEEQTKTWEQT